MSNPFDNPGFKYHFFAYALVNSILIIVNLLQRDHWWFFWPLIGWGIGLAAHAWAVSKTRPRARPANTPTAPRP